MVEKMAAHCTTAQWQEKLQALKVPNEQVGDVDEDYMGILLFQHFDFEGIFMQTPCSFFHQDFEQQHGSC